MTSEELVTAGFRKGHPLCLCDTGETVYFRSVRYSPHFDGVLAVVIDEGQNHMAVTAEELEPLGSAY